MCPESLFVILSLYWPLLTVESSHFPCTCAGVHLHFFLLTPPHMDQAQGPTILYTHVPTSQHVAVLLGRFLKPVQSPGCLLLACSGYSMACTQKPSLNVN